MGKDVVITAKIAITTSLFPRLISRGSAAGYIERFATKGEIAITGQRRLGARCRCRAVHAPDRKSEILRCQSPRFRRPATVRCAPGGAKPRSRLQREC